MNKPAVITATSYSIRRSTTGAQGEWELLMRVGEKDTWTAICSCPERGPLEKRLARINAGKAAA